ncbi:MAG: hypothetical protein CMP77_14880 [Flavobacterium sp.]|nr:hypothetical protein [Flavobacterium sp.]|tara:strand:- start:23785 stop:24315 length:531 start_codon:yes stop_codon:yes gene_type:complete
MKNIIITAIIATVIATYFWSCEKDDICAEDTPTTPNMIVTFYNADNQEVRKSGRILQFMEGDSIEGRDAVAVDSLVVPLGADAESVRWGFTLVTNAPGGGLNYNTDYIEFKYTHNEVYISRACGFKSLFYLKENTNEEPNPVLTDTIPADNLWIQEIQVIESNIENENTEHIKIFY